MLLAYIEYGPILNNFHVASDKTKFDSTDLEAVVNLTCMFWEHRKKPK